MEATLTCMRQRPGSIDDYLTRNRRLGTLRRYILIIMDDHAPGNPMSRISIMARGTISMPLTKFRRETSI